ncbi:flagellar export chaperone FliS [Anoxynatronum buryatiense]|nr:flagellar export chaperone FliS [Anoxynatronum buryatiense]
MKNPYAAYQKFAKNKPVVQPTAQPKKEEVDPAISSAQEEVQVDQVTQNATPVSVPPKVREGFVPPREKVPNPNLYQMKKTLDLEGEKKKASQPSKNNVKASNPYLESKINTATPEELVLMLYDGALRFLKQTVIHLEVADKSKAHEASLRAQTIVAELMGGLDRNYGISEQFHAMYDFIYRLMREANVEKSASKTQEAIELLTDMRTTWQDAMKKAKMEQ